MIDVDAMMDELRVQISEKEEELAGLQKLKATAVERGFYVGPDPTPRGSIQRVKSGGRRQELREFLSEHGPMKAAEIVQKSGIPKGTVDYLLTQKEHFRSRGEGLWEPVPREHLTVTGPLTAVLGTDAETGSPGTE